MIISASRRTDMPAFFGDWLVKCLEEKKVSVRNPINPKIVTELSLEPELIDCIVFWTKDPRNFLRRLPEIDALGHRYYFQFTLTPYDSSIERSLDKTSIVETFIALSEHLGKEKVVWRYDPIFINDKFTLSYHLEQFEALCRRLCNYTEKCVISFIDPYPFLKKRFMEHNIREPSGEETAALAEGLSALGKKHGLSLAACCEKADLNAYGIERNKCIDGDLIERLFNRKIKQKKDPSQRPNCGCCASRDIGVYNTCLHDCVYCYAKRGTPLSQATSSN
jgi:DNA repair photolyase